MNSVSLVPSLPGSEEPETGEPISRSPYTARLLGSADEELASQDFFRLVEAIRWLTDAEESGALAWRAGIFSANGELVWARLFEQKDEPRERVMKNNAARILVQIDDLIQTEDSPELAGSTEGEDLSATEDLPEVDGPPQFDDWAQFDAQARADDWAKLESWAQHNVRRSSRG